MPSESLLGMCIVEDGSLFLWGRNNQGQLGHGPGAPSFDYKPKKVRGISEIKDVALGAAHTLAATGIFFCSTLFRI